MKTFQIKTVVFLLMSAITISGCKKLLDETPRSSFTPEFFKTQAGVQGGITAAYRHMRDFNGQPYFYNTLETGTDEYTYAQSADANFRDMDLSGVGIITPAGSRSDAVWNSAFTNINTCSGVIEYGGSIGTIPASLIAEARFFRAFDYFTLVQLFGGVPLDLGSGKLQFNQTPSRSSVRNTVPEVYAQAIFPDLVKAVADLPVTPRVTGGVTRNVARLYLAKAYLTYAWWLENPNNIPTYPSSPRTDPDGHPASWYFQKAYDISVEGINEPGSYGLVDTYYDIHVGSNDRNKEVMLYADHTQDNALYNGSPITGFESEVGTPAGRNTAVWMVTSNYTILRSASTSTGGGSAISSVQREAAQFLGRPYTRMCPPIGVFTNTFAEKTLDSRYDGTFTSVYRGNWPKGYNPQSSAPATLYNANDLPVVPGDAILSFLEYDAQAVGLVYPTGATFAGKVSNNVGAGQMPGRSDFVIAPSGISRIVFPGLWKLGVYRTDNAAGLGEPNVPSTRPFNIAKYSEFYFVAAEANVKGAIAQAGKSARDLLNVIRARAGKWKFSNKTNAAFVADNSAAMTAATPATITLNYLLAERSREYFGEGYRWYDLVRTQKWNELAGSYQICAATYGAHTPQTFTRTIEPRHYLRPIPQSQIDAMEATAAEKAAYQNPGY